MTVQRQQQRIAVARALAARPDLVLADEPTGALDARNSGIVLAALRELADQGSCVLLVTHDPAAARQADRTITLAPLAARPRTVDRCDRS